MPEFGTQTAKARKSRSKKIVKVEVVPAKRRKVAGGGGLLNWFKGANPMKPRMRVKMAYTDVFQKSVGSSGLFGSETVMVLNDMFDPDFAVGGHQPYGRDNFAALYTKYKVTGCTIEATFNNPNIDGMAVSMQLVNPTQTSFLAGATISQVAERQNTSTKLINDSGSQKSTFKMYVPLWRLAGLTKLQFEADSDKFNAVVGASPATKLYARFSVADSAMGSVGLCQLFLKLTYHVTWYNREQLGQS